MQSLKGCGVATVTPFRNGIVDLQALTRVLEHQIAGGVDYLVCLGTTAETATLSEDEQRKVIEHTLKVNNARVPVVLGNFGGNNTAEILTRFDRFDLSDIAAILSVSPYYNKPSQEGIYQHYMALADRSPVPIIMYNVPGRTASNINAETVIRLSSHPQICGVKDAASDMVQDAEIRKGVASDFLLLSGDDATTLALMGIGGDGVISVIANAYPRMFVEMVHAASSGDYDKAAEINMKLIRMDHWLYLEGNPVGIKGCLSILGLCSDEVRLPLVPISKDVKTKMADEMKGI